MVNIEKLSKDLTEYEERKIVYDGILNLINQTDISQEYEYKGVETTLLVKENKQDDVGKPQVRCDILFTTNKESTMDGVIMVEQTFDPSHEEKINQLKGYIHTDPQGILATVGVNHTCAKDIFLIVPFSARGDAQKLYDEIIKQIGEKPGQKYGLTIWYHDKKVNNFTCCGGVFHATFLSQLGLLGKKVEIENIQANEFYPFAPILEILRYMIMKLYAIEHGNTTIATSEEKLRKMFRPWGFNNNGLMKQAIKLGGEIGLFMNVNVESYYAELIYNKDHASTIKTIATFFNKPEEFIRKRIEEKNENKVKKPKDNTTQKGLEHWQTPN